MKSITKLLVLVSTPLVASGLQAQIIYVDAVENGNTIQADGGAMVTTTDGSGIDGIWRARAFGNDATIFEANGGFDADTEDTPRLKTTISGLPLDTYNVFAYFWSDGSSWRLGASLTDEAGELPVFVGGGAPSGSPLPTAALAEDFGTVPLLSEGNRTLWQVSLGTATGTSIDVFIDNDALVDRTTGNSFDYRTWYDGVGYSVVPEPTTAALFGLGASALLFFRRKNA